MPLTHRACGISRDMVNATGTLPETVTLGCLPQVLPKWTAPAHGWQSWSQGWWWEIHLVEARGFYLLSLGCCHWRKWREKEGDRGRERKKKREKSEPGLGGAVLTSTDQWPPLSLCFTAQIRSEDIWSSWEASLLSHSQANTLQQHHFAAGYSLNAYRTYIFASNTEKQKQNNQASLTLLDFHLSAWHQIIVFDTGEVDGERSSVLLI